MKNFERIAETPEALGAFLTALPIASGPWDVEFHRTFCNACTAANCDGDNCPHNAQRNNPLWWLIQEAEQGHKTELFQAMTEAGPGMIVNLGPGVSFRLEKTQVSGPCSMEDSAGAEALFTLKDLCGYCRMLAKNKWAIQTEREWDADVAALEFAISVLSELREIKEVRIQAEPNTPGAWELMRDILAGTRPAPEGTVLDVVIDLTGNPQAIRRREEPEAAARALAIAMPDGGTVKLNSAAEAYNLAGCIEKMAARVWPEAAPGK